MKAKLNHNNPSCIINLKRLSSENAEMILSWRNSEKVRANSLDERKIQLSDHIDFIENLNTEKRHIFIVEIHNDPQGVFDVNEIGDLIGIWGCYLSDTKTIRPGVFPLMVALAGRLAFEELKLQNLRSEVLAHNIAPQRLNDYLGLTNVRRCEEKKGSSISKDIICYELSKGDWDSVLTRITKILPSYFRDDVHKVRFPK